tara:strand:+ start:270 stop:887 length:618 start_codon:yes stop_codon:yes gene_type:complete
MALSSVQISNMALSHIGADSTIESMTESSSEAAQANLWYDYSRLQVLEAYDWGFSRKRLDLAIINTISDDTADNAYYEWVYRYQYPADCIAMRKISNPNGVTDDAIPFDIETTVGNQARVVMTNMEDAIAVYTFDNESPSMFSAHFVDTLAALLAHRMAFSLTGSRAVSSDMLNLYQGMIRIAPAHDANERMSQPPRESEWVRGR